MRSAGSPSVRRPQACRLRPSRFQSPTPREVNARPLCSRAAQFGNGGKLFVNDEDENVVETADPANGKAGPTIALPGCTGPQALVIRRRDNL